MPNKRKPRDESPSASSTSGLVELATHITDLVQREALDPRFARKLLKRLLNEAEALGDDATLDAAFRRLEHAVNGIQAGELVAAVVALRAEQGRGTKEKDALKPGNEAR